MASLRMRITTALTAAALGLLSTLAVVLGGSGVSGAAPVVPYTDPNAVGYIGLCNQAGQQITSGSINTDPFTWRAVSSQPAPSDYAVPGQTAILLAYQPQEGLEASEWSGDSLTASSRYSNASNPMAAATDRDGSLAVFMQEYLPKWDGFLQLRMYLGAPNKQQYDLTYPALNIQVTGDTWTAVGGGPVDCASGTAESLETIVLPSSTTTTTTSPGGSSTPSITPTGHGSGSGGTSGGSTGSSKGSVTPTGGASPANGTVAATPTSSHAAVIAAAVLVALAGLVALVSLLRRRRTEHAHSPAGTAEHEPKEGQSP